MVLPVEHRYVQIFFSHHEALPRAQLGGSMAGGDRLVCEGAGSVESEVYSEACVEE